MIYRVVALFTILVLFINFVHGQVGNVDQNAHKKPTIVFVGVYHMADEGNNVFKGAYDDILSADRQAELTALVAKLREFRPTKIVIERDLADSVVVMKKYQEYLNGRYELTRNETEQIGFRLAKELDQKKIYPVDWGVFPDDQLYWYENFAKTIPELEMFHMEWKESIALRYEKSNEELLKLTILDRIRRLNEPAVIEQSHREYFDIMRIGWKDKYVGANYLSWWYGRNMKILVNIIRITESPDDRILVIYGSGHSKLLNQLTIDSNFYNVVRPLDILED
jgi:hypothetical protein